MTFKEYFEDQGLPFSYDGTTIHNKDGWDVSAQPVRPDEFEQYKPVLDLIADIYQSDPAQIRRGLGGLSNSGFELSVSSGYINMELQGDDVRANMSSNHYGTICVSKNGTAFRHSQHIEFDESVTMNRQDVVQWLSDFDKEHVSIARLAKDSRDDLSRDLANINFEPEPVEFGLVGPIYRNITEENSLKEYLQRADLGYIIDTNESGSVSVLTPEAGLIVYSMYEALDAEDVPHRFIKATTLLTERFVTERTREDAVHGVSSASQMIPIEHFESDARQFLTNYRTFSTVCERSDKRLRETFQSFNDDIELSAEDVQINTNALRL